MNKSLAQPINRLRDNMEDTGREWESSTDWN